MPSWYTASTCMGIPPIVCLSLAVGPLASSPDCRTPRTCRDGRGSGSIQAPICKGCAAFSLTIVVGIVEAPASQQRLPLAASERKWLILLVGGGQFERPTPCAQGRCATRLRYAPTCSHFTTLPEHAVPDSCLMQDEPEPRAGFSRKMSLKAKSAMLGIDHQHGRFRNHEPGADPGLSGRQRPGAVCRATARRSRSEEHLNSSHLGISYAVFC